MVISAVEMGSLGRPPVVDAIASASRRTGVDFDYLLRTAERESSLNPEAKASTSSAAGLYQFVKQTWLATLKEHGAAHGFAAEATAIEDTGAGCFRVADPAREAEILALRNDPAAAAAMAAELASDNADVLQGRLGRPATSGELYAAHVLGAQGAASLIEAANATPGLAAEELFPQAAAANRGLFYDRAGNPVSVESLHTRLTGAPAREPVGDDRGAPLLADVRGPESESVPVGSVDGEPSLASAFPPAPSSAASSRYGFGRAPLALTPQVLAILAALDPIPGKEKDGTIAL